MTLKIKIKIKKNPPPFPNILCLLRFFLSLTFRHVVSLDSFTVEMSYIYLSIEVTRIFNTLEIRTAFFFWGGVRRERFI